MSAQNAPVYAAIDVGSNTIHVVVARCTAHDLTILADEVVLVRIGESVTATGEISAQKCEAAIATIQQYQALAKQHGAAKILVVATEAIRKASNNAAFIAAVEEVTGLHMVLVDGMVEATLTFMGATYSLLREPRDHHASTELGVMDLGGGSTELITAEGEQIAWRTSLPLGSGWLHDRYLPSNPPTRDELEAAQTFLHTFLDGLPLKHLPSALIVTGGSANSVFYLAQHAFGINMAQENLNYDDLLRCQGLLYALPAAEIARRYQQPEGRAMILPAGATIIQAVMQHFQLDEIRISPHGIREGVLLAYARYGEQWLEQMTAQATQQPETAHDVTEDSGDELAASDASFIRVGRQLIMERARKMLSWRDEVLRNEDPEAVHKMRVATRRLRAALDAYASLCDQKALRKGYRRVKKLADALGNARDIDVMIHRLQEQRERIHDERQEGIGWLIERLQEYRQQQQNALASLLRRLDRDELLTQLQSCLPEGER